MYDFDRTEQDRTGLTFSKLILFTLLFALFAAPGWASSVQYRYATVDTNNVVTWHDNGSAADPTQVTNSTTTWSNGWYYIPAGEQPVTIATRINVNGTVNLILCDGATLKATAGITVAEGNTLNIYGQTNGTGKLEATGGFGAAGIGGGMGGPDMAGGGGTVKIYGGTVTATGGDGAQGIGGGVKDYGGLGAPGTLTLGTGVKLYGGENENPTTLLDPDDDGKIINRPRCMTAVSFVPVTGVLLDKYVLDFVIDGTMEGTLKATVSPDNALSKDVVWSSDKPAVATVDNNGNVTGVGAGTATVTVTATNGLNAAFYHVSADCRVTVNKGTPKVTAPTKKNGLIYDGTAQALVTAGTTTGGTLQYSLDNKTYAETIPTRTNAGTYTVYYKVEGGENYIDVTPENNTLEVTIGKADIQPSVSITGWTYGQTANAPSVTGNPGNGTVTYAYKVKGADNSTYSATVPSAVGSYTVRATVAETANYKGATATADFTISAKPGGNTDSGSGTTDPVTPDPVKPDPVKPDDSGNNGNNTGSETVSPDKEPDPEPTPEQQKAVEEAKKELEQDTADKAAKAGEAAKTVDTSTEGGRALADLMSGNAQDSTKETQAAALEVKEALEETGTDLSTLTPHDIEKAVENKQQEREAKVFEAAGKVEDPTVPAATDLLTEYGSNTDLQDANAKLTVQPKLVQPEVLSADEATKAVENIKEAANNNDVAEGVNFDAVQAAAQPEAIKTSADITIEPASTTLTKQTEAVEKVFNSVSADLAGANGGNGAVIATVLPKMRPNKSGFFPLRVNLRHLMPGRRLRFWPSAAHFKQASGSVSVSVASGQEGDFFFLDENGVPTATVSGDASKMTAVAFLTANVPYDSAFITTDATEKDQETLTDLAEKANPNGGENNPDNPDSPTSNKGSGGCDAGLGVAGLAALLPALTKKRK